MNKPPDTKKVIVSLRETVTTLVKHGRLDSTVAPLFTAAFDIAIMASTGLEAAAQQINALEERVAALERERPAPKPLQQDKCGKVVRPNPPNTKGISTRCIMPPGHLGDCDDGWGNRKRKGTGHLYTYELPPELHGEEDPDDEEGDV